MRRLGLRDCGGYIFGGKSAPQRRQFGKDVSVPVALSRLLGRDVLQSVRTRERAVQVRASDFSIDVIPPDLPLRFPPPGFRVWPERGRIDAGSEVYFESFKLKFELYYGQQDADTKQALSRCD
jgi:hypothetical protein